MFGSRYAVVLVAVLVASWFSLVSAIAVAASSTPGDGGTDSSSCTEFSVDALLGVALGQSVFRRRESTLPGGGSLESAGQWSMSYLIIPRVTLGQFDLAAGLMLEQRISTDDSKDASFGFGETLLNARWQGYQAPDIGFQVSPTATLVLPTAPSNSSSDLSFAGELGVDARKRLGDWLEVAMTLGVRKNINGSETHWVEDGRGKGDFVDPTAGVDRTDRSAHPFYPSFQWGGASWSRPDLDNGDPSVSFSYRGGLGLTAWLRPALSFSVGYSLYSLVPYDRGNDDPLVPRAMSNAPSESMRLQVATVDVRYSAVESLCIGLGTEATQPTTNVDDSPRFPFWDISDPYDTHAVVRLYVLGSY